MVHEGRVKPLPADYSSIRAVLIDSGSNFKAVQSSEAYSCLLEIACESSLKLFLLARNS